MKKILGWGQARLEGGRDKGGQSSASTGESPQSGARSLQPWRTQRHIPRVLSRQKGSDGPDRIIWMGSPTPGLARGQEPPEKANIRRETRGDRDGRAGEGVDMSLEQV